MEFEEKFGVKVDSRIPKEERLELYKLWEKVLSGNNSYSNPATGNSMTRYEHVITGSGAGWPPDPFRILASYQENPDLERIIRRRKALFLEGGEARSPASSIFFPKFNELTGQIAEDFDVFYINPPVSVEGRVPIPKVVAFQSGNQRLELSDNVLQQLQFPTTIVTRLSPAVKVREFFNYNGGYRIELASSTLPNS